MSRRLFLVAAFIVAALLPHGGAQLQLNTTVRSFTSVPGSPWVADIWTHTDGQGREFALVCRGNQGLSIYEITNPVAPVFASSIAATGSDLKDVKTYQNFAYAVQQSGSMMAIDITNPYAPMVTSSFGGCAHNVSVDHQQGLLIETRNGCSPANVRFYSLANPAMPVQISTYTNGSGFNSHDAYAQDGLAYVSVLFGATAGTDILDISNPANPIFLNKVLSGDVSHSCWLYNAPGGQKVLCSTNETAGGHLRIFDVTDPMNTPLLSEYTTDPGISIHNPLVIGRYCYISYYGDYLRILDLANPSAPQEVGIFDPTPSNVGVGTFDGAWGVAYVKPLGNNAHRVVVTESFNTPFGFWVVDFTPGPVLDMTLSTTGVGDLSLSVSGADPFTPLFNPVSANVSQNFGAGPVVGLQGDALFSLLVPPNTQPFSVTTNAAGAYNLTLPPASIPTGLSVDVVSIGIVGGAATSGQLGRIHF